MKLIREGRFGPPKCYKTGAVVSSYPRPLLCLEYDNNGLSVINEEILWIDPKNIDIVVKSISQPPLAAIDFTKINVSPLTENYVPRADKDTMPATIKTINALYNNCPWKTVVLDTVTGLSDCIYGHQSATNASALADPRKWAGNIGMKVKQIIDVLVNIKAHVVVIFHSEQEKNELSGVIREVPLVYSKLREFLGGMFDQFLYATKVNGKPVIKTTDYGFATGIGCRWPANLKPEVGPLFTDIYGKEINS